MVPWEKQFDVDERLDKAMQTFWSHGFEATSMQKLVDCMGINRGSLYDTYGDKHALFVAALRRYDEKMRSATLADLEAEYGPRDAMRRLFEMFAEPALNGRPAEGCFLTNSALELAAHDTEVRKIVAHAQQQIEDFFARMVRRGQEEGEINAGLLPDETASGLLASLQGMVVLTRSRPEKALLGAVIDDAMRRLS